MITHHHASGAVDHRARCTGDQHSEADAPADIRLAAASTIAAAAAANVETVVVTSSKIKGDIQTVPIAITALSQEQLTSRQIAGGPDLVKEVPNLTFTKTNFTGYNIQIRGIGTQAISVTTDPAVAVAFNDTPFLRNHFFEQEFFDVSQVEVLRGPQGTLYGRNATAGVVNMVSAKPTDQFEAMLSADWGNYTNRRYEGMVNIPIVDDRLDLRVAGEWTKRDGYSFNQTTEQAHRRPRSVVEPRHAGLQAAGRICRPMSSGNISRKMTTASVPPSSFAKRIPGPSVVDGLDLSTAGNANFFQIHGSARAVCRYRFIRRKRSKRRTASPFRSWRRANSSSTAAAEARPTASCSIRSIPMRARRNPQICATSNRCCRRPITPRTMCSNSTPITM